MTAHGFSTDESTPRQADCQPPHSLDNHLHLVFLAYALLTHMAIGDGRRAQDRQPLACCRSTADLQDELRRMLWDDLTNPPRHFSSGAEVIKELQRLLVAA